MRALSVKQPFAELIASGKKKKEFRSTRKACFGELLIVASKGLHRDAKRFQYDPDSLVFGRMVCVVDFHAVTEDPRDGYAWHFRNPRRVEPRPWKGFAAFYTVDDDQIRYLAAPASVAPARASVARVPKEKRTSRAARTAPAALKSTATASVNARRAVVVDTDPRRATAYAETLQEFGFGVLIARAGNEAWKTILTHRPALVVAQAMLPELSGIELLYRARGRAVLEGLRFLLAGDPRLLRSVACDGVLASPDDLRAFLKDRSEHFAPSVDDADVYLDDDGVLHC